MAVPLRDLMAGPESLCRGLLHCNCVGLAWLQLGHLSVCICLSEEPNSTAKTLWLRDQMQPTSPGACTAAQRPLAECPRDKDTTGTAVSQESSQWPLPRSDFSGAEVLPLAIASIMACTTTVVSQAWSLGHASLVTVNCEPVLPVNSAANGQGLCHHFGHL